METNCRGSVPDGRYCCLHPRDVVVGVCAACLKERLVLVLASEHGRRSRVSTNKSKDAQTIRPCRSSASRRRSGISLSKVFALGSFLHRLDSRRRRPDDDSDDPDSIASLEDSFISIKFEDNGNALWDNKKPPLPPMTTTTTITLASSNGSGTTASGGGRGDHGGRNWGHRGGAREEGRRAAVEEADWPPAPAGAVEEVRPPAARDSIGGSGKTEGGGVLKGRGNWDEVG